MNKKDEKKELQRKMQNTEDIRNVTIIAHVDHGKTSLTDSILAQAGMMNMKDAGRKLKLDDEEIEQRRQMTVYASHVTISYQRNFLTDKTEFMAQCQTCGRIFLQRSLKDYLVDFKSYSKNKPPNWYQAAVKHWLDTDHDVQSVLQDNAHRDVISHISVEWRRSGKRKEQILKEMETQMRETCPAHHA